MRSAFLVILLGATLPAQSLVEHSAAAAGGAVGGVAGKKVSDAVTSIFNKVDKAAAKAAADKERSGKEKNEPLFEVGPGVPHSRGAEPKAEPATRESVPAPPPLHHASARGPARTPRPAPASEPAFAPIEPPPPPPVTTGELRTVAVGENRDEVLKLGVPAARITMFEDGHLVEIFRYVSQETNVGTVRLSDGAVASVQVN